MSSYRVTCWLAHLETERYALLFLTLITTGSALMLIAPRFGGGYPPWGLL